MMRRARLVCCSCAIALVLFLLPISPARAGDNATITNDRVNLRAEPATSGKILATMGKGSRVELLFVAGFSETVDGRTGSWYAVAFGSQTGFVFGPYVSPDSGAVPAVEGPAYDGPKDRLFYFVQILRHLFGRDEAEVIARLGKPRSIQEGEWGKCEGVKTKVFNYPTLHIGLFYPTKSCDFTSEQEFVSEVMITGGDQRILGIGIMSPLRDAIEALGWDYTDTAVSDELSELIYVPGDFPPYVVEVVYRNVLKVDAVVRQEVMKIGFSVNVLGD